MWDFYSHKTLVVGIMSFQLGYLKERRKQIIIYILMHWSWLIGGNEEDKNHRKI